ncbi:MAG: Rab family GTPase [Promethearchaeota archaeon]
MSMPTKPSFIFKVPVAGDGAVGKTSLIVRYTQGTFTDTYKMTIGTSFAVKTVDLEKVVVKLQIWDLAGQPHFGGVRPLFYQGSTGVIYVFSVTDRASFDHLAGWIEEARKNSGNIPGILIGNKTDLLDQRVVSRQEAEAFAAQAGLQYIETSAKMDENVGDAFRQVAITIMQTKPEYGIVKEAEKPAAPVAPEPDVVPPPPEEPAQTPTEEKVLTAVDEPTADLFEPEEEPEPIPLIGEDTEPVIETPSSPADEPEPVVPVEPPPVGEPEPVVVSPPVQPEPTPEDVVVTPKAESSLVEFIGTDPHSISAEDFERRSVHAMQRLGVSEVGVLGTFLRSLIRQGQRDVVLESLESLQEEQ